MTVSESKPLTLTCAYQECGRQFGHLHKRGPVPSYCSPECRRLAWKLRNPGYDKQRKARAQERAAGQRVCAYEPCGLAFQPGDPRQRYHSRECKDRAHSARQRACTDWGACSVEGCERTPNHPAMRIPLCGMHYRRQRLHGDPLAGGPVRGGRMGIVPCEVPGCDRTFYAQGLCSLHYNRARVKGDAGPAGTLKAGAGEGCLFTDEDGYQRFAVYVEGKRVTTSVHRRIMEQLLGRELKRHETVHHVNGQRADNQTDGPLRNFRSGNLELWSSWQPAGQRVADKVEFAVSLLREYAPDHLKG